MMKLVARNELYGLEYIEASVAQLIQSVPYLEQKEQEVLIDTCYYAASAHEGQKRRSGEPYICHPIKVADILAREVRFDLAVLQAAVLHDVIEDTFVCKDEILACFGEEVTRLVDGVSKLDKDKDISPERLQAQTFSKLVEAMEADPRVVMIKFADRMHNMQTLDALRPDKRRRIASETLDVYAPIASRLGMFAFKSELEELSFKHANPWRYNIVRKVIKDNKVRTKTAEEAKKLIKEACELAEIDITINKRHRNLLSVYNKIQGNRRTRRPLENASIPFIVLTKNIEDCYRVLGVIHQLFPPVFKKLSDYIASPKVNGYQSIHTSVLSKKRRVMNFQIRTEGMHAIAEAGIIAIWRQHNQQKQAAESQTLPVILRDKSMRHWLGNIKELQNLVNDPLDYYEIVKRDLTGFDIQVFTPNGDTIALPKGASIIDFAYHVHTDLGNRLVAGKVNGIDVSVDFALRDGQTVELISDNSAYPSTQWLKIVKTARARAAIRYYFRNIPQEDLQIIGKRSLIKAIKRRGYLFVNLDNLLHTVCQKRNISEGQLMESIALDEIKQLEIIEELQGLSNRDGFVSTFCVEVKNQPGALAAVANLIGQTSANIESVNLPDNMQDKIVEMRFVLRMSTLEQLDMIMIKLENLKLVKTIKHEEK